MKKKILAIGLSLGLIGGLCACGNQTFIDTTYTFDKAIIELPNGESFEGRVDSWTDFDESGEQIQVTINGVTYLTSIQNVILIAE